MYNTIYLERIWISRYQDYDIYSSVCVCLAVLSSINKLQRSASIKNKKNSSTLKQLTLKYTVQFLTQSEFHT